MRMIALATTAALSALALSAPAMTQDVAQPAANPQIDYDGFTSLTIELAEVRAAHRLPLDQWLALSRADGAILLDTRSAAAFAEGHIDGAINLPFSDFTDEKLAQVLGPDVNRPIYIYCNNNFTDDIAPIVSKRAPLALNIPTFINLHGYGYTNVWELADVVPTSSVPWVRAADS
ncbi:MAG: rhodanese-like domain-containing protein [Sphingomonadaceae bacterium]